MQSPRFNRERCSKKRRLVQVESETPCRRGGTGFSLSTFHFPERVGEGLLYLHRPPFIPRRLEFLRRKRIADCVHSAVINLAVMGGRLGKTDFLTYFK